MLNNLTTIEYREKKEEMTENKYNIGYLENFKQVFGNNIFLWLLPVRGTAEDGGYFFQINENASFKPKENKKNSISQYKEKDSVFESKLDLENKSFSNV